MIIDWSEEALAELAVRYGEKARIWKLVSDSAGCGCAMNGVAALWLIDGPEQGDLQAESNGADVWYEKRHEIFFDERMRVSYEPSRRAFKLSSDGQIYSNQLRLEDRRTPAV
ncbi:iron-sulfur cluster biosynthesis family protein [Cohnella hongkongensis]|uniref:Iron-sulfur cluster biosynthesis family protein n=1 Tax=Cohnella hongkongensis TaxID=178337 RepID=A0ABV9F7Q9_9BACL